MSDLKPDFRIPTPEECDALLAELDIRRRVLLFVKRQHRAAAGEVEQEPDEPEGGEK